MTTDGTDPAPGLLKSGWWKGLRQIAIWLAAFMVARWAGLIALILLGATAATHWALKRWQPTLTPRQRLILAVNLGYATGLSVGVFTPGGAALVGPDIILMVALSLWFWRRKGVMPLWILIVYHLGATGWMWADPTAPTFRLSATVAHTIFRAFAVAVMGVHLWEQRPSRRLRPSTGPSGLK
jgi:hypothetical protein